MISTNADNLFKNGKWHLLLQLETEQSYTNKPRAWNLLQADKSLNPLLPTRALQSHGCATSVKSSKYIIFGFPLRDFMTIAFPILLSISVPRVYFFLTQIWVQWVIKSESYMRDPPLEPNICWVTVNSEVHPCFAVTAVGPFSHYYYFVSEFLCL